MHGSTAAFAAGIVTRGVRLAMPLIDGPAVDDLAALCAELGRHTFMLSVAPPRIHGLTGVPVNLVALF